MTTTKLDSFDHAVNTAATWLSDIAEHLETDNRRAAYRATRAWLHLLRDRLTVNSVAKFGAQLPELIRGMYYDGWNPSQAPIKYTPQEYVTRFATETATPTDEVPQTAASITAALYQHMPGQMEEALLQLPHTLRALIEHGQPAPSTTAHKPETGDDLASLRERVETLTDAVRTLVTGLEGTPLDEDLDSDVRRARAARLAAEMLMTIR
jgi:uncharacterized protein (DUF2267 family)